MIIALACLTLVDLLVRFYICRSAIGEARGQKRSRWYIVFAAALAIFLILSAIGNLLPLGGGVVSLDWRIVTALVDLTSAYALMETVILARRIRKLTWGNG